VLAVVWLQIEGAETAPVQGERFLIGRAPGCDVQLDDPKVSAEHAWVEASNGSLKIQDLGSLEGTWVDGERVHERELTGGERIVVGDTALRLSRNGAPPQPTRPKAFGRWRIAVAVGGAAALGALLAILLLPGGGHRPPPGIPTNLGPQAPPAEQGVGARKRIRPVLGVNGQFLFAFPLDQVNAQLDAMTRAGVHVMRMDADWQLMEPGAPGPDGVHKWRWSRHDPFVEMFARHGIEWVPIIGYSATWAASRSDSPLPGKSPPRDFAQYAAFASAFAQRYGERGSFWKEHPDLPYKPVKRYEIWNEPNLAKVFWWPKPDPRAFAQLYLQARAAIKAVDPTSTVITGGLAGRDDAPSFTRRMFKSVPQLRGRVDGFGFHPYGRTAQESYIRTKLVRKALDSVGQAGVPLDITEVGWSTPPGAAASKGRVVSEKQRARFLSEITKAYPRSDCGIRLFLPHTWVSFEKDPSNQEDWFGIWNHDGSAKPSGRAFVTQLRKAQASAVKPQYKICG
jgi:hypothetical protein